MPKGLKLSLTIVWPIMTFLIGQTAFVVFEFTTLMNKVDFLGEKYGTHIEVDAIAHSNLIARLSKIEGDLYVPRGRSSRMGAAFFKQGGS